MSMALPRLVAATALTNCPAPLPLYSGERGGGEGADLVQVANPLTPTPLPRVQGRGDLSDRL